MQNNIYEARDKIRLLLNESGKYGYLPSLPHLDLVLTSEEQCENYTRLEISLRLFLVGEISFPVTLKIPKDGKAPLCIFALDGPPCEREGYGAFFFTSDLALFTRLGFRSVFKRSRKRSPECDRAAAVAYAILACFDALLLISKRDADNICVFTSGEFTKSAVIASSFDGRLVIK